MQKTDRETVRKLLIKLHKEVSEKLGDLETNRQAFDEQGITTPLPEGVVIEEQALNSNHSEQQQHTLSGEWLKYTGNKTNKIILYFHGGGYSVGSALSHRPLCARLCKISQCDILSVNYRLAPENKYPCALNDAVSSYQFLLDKGFKPQQIFLAGDSAGGGLVMACLLKIREQNSAMPAGAIGLSPWLDLECSSDSYEKNKDIDLMAGAEGLRFVGRAYAKKNINKDPFISPFYAEDLTDLCPLLLQVGDAETLLDETQHFADKAKQQGVSVNLQVWPNMTHVWHSLYGVLPEAEQALNAISDWIKLN